MYTKIRKTLAEFWKIWIFLAILLIKAFPHAAYAFSTVDACAAQPECAAALGSELAPTVAAPSGTGFGASTLGTTTATGTTTACVQAVGKVAVVVRVARQGYVIWHYWNQSNNEQAQNKAKQKYCAANQAILYVDSSGMLTVRGYVLLHLHVNLAVISTRAYFMPLISIF